MYKSKLISTLASRGFIYQGANMEGLDEICSRGPVTGYVGFDATAQSLHVGSLAVIMVGKWMQLLGHNPIFLLGGGTTKIGDPSWRNKERPILSIEKINSNISNIQKVFSKILSFDGPHKAELCNNADWLDSVEYIKFLRDIGVHFSVNRMLSLEHIKSRLEQETHLSFIEFNYILLQSYDFLKLFQDKNCVLQFGGSDQWGNIICGIDLIRRITGKEACAFTTHLVTTASGAKMGKTADGAVWLDPNLVSAYEYWQFWRNVDDCDVEKFLKLFTLLPLDEIEKLASLKNSEVNHAKIVLADHATALLHGEDKIDCIHSTVKSVFENSGNASSALPSCNISHADIQSGLGILEALMLLEFITSRREGRQFIRDGIVAVNDTTIANELFNFVELLNSDMIQNCTIKISIGKKKHGVIRID